MPLVSTPRTIKAHGNIDKNIDEYFGRLSHQDAVSIARMVSPAGWEECGQTPEFDEYTVVTQGVLTVETREGCEKVSAGQAYFAPKGEWVRYSSPDSEGADYISVCAPAFAPELVNRDTE